MARQDVEHEQAAQRLKKENMVGMSRADEEGNASRSDDENNAYLQRMKKASEALRIRKARRRLEKAENSPPSTQSRATTPRARSASPTPNHIRQPKRAPRGCPAYKAARNRPLNASPPRPPYNLSTTPARPRPDPWQIGSRPAGSPPSTRMGSGQYGPWDIDKELGLSPRREGESSFEHLERLHQEALAEDALINAERALRERRPISEEDYQEVKAKGKKIRMAPSL